MPLINGQKMACEPCIRGHRSTKCTHANERLMVPVRKPGRPLSSCPHLASRPCSCAAVTAAIPKKQQCHCGTSSVDDETDNDGSSAGATPPSPSKSATSSSYRVQKSASKSGSSKKPFDPAGLERMDASQLNILSPFDAGQQKPTSTPVMAPMLNMHGYGVMGFMPPGNSFGPEPALFPMFQPQHMPSPISNPTTSKPATNGHYSPQMNGTIGSSTAPPPGSCCGGGGKAPQAQQTPKPNGVEQHKPKSCCSSGTDSPEIESEAELLPAPVVHPQANGLMMPAFQGPVAMPNGMFPYFPQPSVFAYPPQYGSYLQPLQPEQWRQLMTMNYGHPMPNTAYGVPATVSFCQPSAVNGSSWTSHQCRCGDACQCVGCATHPYNRATQDYVRSAWNTMMEDSQKQRERANGNRSMANSNHGTPSNQTPNGMATTPVPNPSEETVSPTAAPTPSDAASGVGEEQTLSGEDFFFVSYPFGDSCEGDMASCPCGDDCQCIGCAIHNPGLRNPAE